MCPVPALNWDLWAVAWLCLWSIHFKILWCQISFSLCIDDTLEMCSVLCKSEHVKDRGLYLKLFSEEPCWRPSWNQLVVSRREKIWRQRFRNILYQQLPGMPQWLLTSCFPSPFCQVAPVEVSPVALQVTEAGDSSCPFEGCETGKTSLLPHCWPWCSLACWWPLHTAVWGLGTDCELTEATWSSSLCAARSLWPFWLAWLRDVDYFRRNQNDIVPSTCPSRAMFRPVLASLHIPSSAHLFSRDGRREPPLHLSKPPGRLRARVWMVYRIQG